MTDKLGCTVWWWGDVLTELEDESYISSEDVTRHDTYLFNMVNEFHERFESLSEDDPDYSEGYGPLFSGIRDYLEANLSPEGWQYVIEFLEENPK
jgi:hypothetical protein